MLGCLLVYIVEMIGADRGLSVWTSEDADRSAALNCTDLKPSDDCPDAPSPLMKVEVSINVHSSPLTMKR